MNWNRFGRAVAMTSSCRSVVLLVIPRQRVCHRPLRLSRCRRHAVPPLPVSAGRVGGCPSAVLGGLQRPSAASLWRDGLPFPVRNESAIAHGCLFGAKRCQRLDVGFSTFPASSCDANAQFKSFVTKRPWVPATPTKALDKSKAALAQPMHASGEPASIIA